MFPSETDVVILGTGTAGLNARREVEKAGKRWFLVDPGPDGTTCARVGCMPSKLLIAAAEAAHDAHRAGLFGIDVSGIRVDGEAVMARVRRERDRFAGFTVRDLEQVPDHLRARQRGRLDGPNTVVLEDGHRIQAGAVVVATGSHPWIPPGYEAVADRVIVNDDVFDWTGLPRRLAVLGAGIIGLELGQALHRLGVDVVILDPAERVLGIADDVVADEALALFSAELPMFLGSRVTAATPEGSGVHLTWTAADGSTHTGSFDGVLAAAGRRPNTADLGLDTLGVELDRRGLPAFDPQTMQVGDLPVFLAGDVNADRPLLHEAADEGRIAGANAARFPDVDRGHRRTPLAVAFTDPQLGLVGAPLSSLDPEEVVVGSVSFASQGRARVMGVNAGVGRIYADRRSCRLLGATLLGPRAEHLAHLLAWAVQEGLTPNEALNRPFYHPVIEEGLRTALVDLSKQLRTARLRPPKDCAECPGA